MFRLLFLYIVAISLATSAFAQDTIVKVNQERIIAKVIEVKQTTVVYRRYNNPDGPLYTIDQSSIFYIAYPDGHRDYFDQKSSVKVIADGSHFIALNLFDCIPGLISLSYEYTFPNREMTLRFPISTGIGTLSGASLPYFNDLLYYNRFKYFSAGCDWLYYPFKQKKASYYLGASAEYTQGVYNDYIYIMPEPTPQKLNYYNFGIGVVNGVLIRPTEHINLSFYATIGMQVNNLDASDYRPMGRAGILMGYRFGKAKSQKS